MTTIASDSEEYLDDLVPGGGCAYETPLKIGNLIIYTTHDYMLQLEAIHTIMREQEYSDEDIQIFDEDCGIEGDADTAYMSIFALNCANDEFKANLDQLAAIAPPASDLNISDVAAKVDRLAEEFGIDALIDIAGGDRITFPPYEPEGPVLAEVSPGVMPPRPASIDQGESKCSGIVFSTEYSKRSFDLRRYGNWNDFLKGSLPKGTTLGREEHFDSMRRRHSQSFADRPMTLSSLSSITEMYDQEERSNMRPGGSLVMMVMSGGQRVNVGTHRLNINQDLFIPLDFSDMELALSELFGAPAGEGMSCPTPSHELHQAVEACLSCAIEKANGVGTANAEYQYKDIFVNFHNHTFEIDITSTHGLWKKPIKQKHMAAVSKYDMACVLTRIGTPDVQRIFSLMIANCLAIEHPAYYGKPNMDDLPLDLVMQYQISDRLHKMSQSTISTLSEMSYNAIVKLSYDFAASKDYKKPGRSFKEKASELLSYIENMPEPKGIAFPPYPISRISGLPANLGDVEIGGHILNVNPVSLANQLSNSSFETEDPKAFLQNFPANGIVTPSEAYQVAYLLHDGILPIIEDGFSGPCPEIEADFVGIDLWNMVNDVYCHNSIAQFAEIRADLIRQVNTNPFPKPGVWRSCSIMKGRVIAWYRSRDPPNSPLGFRIDWFAISSFQTCGSIPIKTSSGNLVNLWPRQKIRSQEFKLASSLPRRLKLTLLSMLEKAKSAGAATKEIILAWQRLAITATSSTWASGANYISCRHLSGSFASPSPPFNEMKSKIKPIKTFACVLYISAVKRALAKWETRDQYSKRCALLNLPRQYAQLEAYWQVWVPEELADPVKHLTDCVLSLHEEYQLLQNTYSARMADLTEQYNLVSKNKITFDDIYNSVNLSCSLDTGGKLGWTVWGALGSAYALNKQGSVNAFDKSYSSGKLSRRITDHLTVRHSMRLTRERLLQTGTVAELIIKQGLDKFLSQAEPTFRFFYVNRPYYFNHAKNGELKDREISIADPDSRIMLNNAELIDGSYGRHTKVDMLKRSDKDAYFYRVSEEALLNGGAIQASDATRFSAMMSNISTGITNLSLGSMGGSAHLLSAAATYRRLASRQMVIDTEIRAELIKRIESKNDTNVSCAEMSCLKWIDLMPAVGRKDLTVLKAYCTAVHTGQGMSHHGTSLAHGGALLMSLAAAEKAQILVAKKRCFVAGIAMVTSDDSTIVAGIDEARTKSQMTRKERQRASKQFLRVQQMTRLIALRTVSVKQNLPKEKLSGVCGEFNSQDTGIGTACPILGFREMICQMVEPTAPSLIGDYLNGDAYARTVALSGQGIMTGVYAHRMYIDSIEARWRLRKQEKSFLSQLTILPKKLIHGSSPDTLLISPSAMLSAPIRGKLMTISYLQSQKQEVLDPRANDTCFGAMLHISVAMPKQHQGALQALRQYALDLESQGMISQSQLILDSLHATAASARTRNIGRIATRIRNRQVSPQDYDGEHFEKSPILETTLSWLHHLEYRVRDVTIAPEIVDLVSSYGTKIVVSNIHHSKFPRPPTRKRSIGIMAKAPIYILEPYGQTPFGRHAIERSGGQLIHEYGPNERAAYSRYRAACAYKKIGEHVRYGSKFQVSWYDMRSGTLKSVIERTDMEIKNEIPVQWALLDKDSLEMLKDLEYENEDTPVLASTFHDGQRMHYHCVWKRQPLTYVEMMDPTNIPFLSSHAVMLRGGGAAIVAITRMEFKHSWEGSGPSKEEIKAFQHYPHVNFPNSQVEGLLRELDGHETLSVPSVAYKTDIDNQTTIFSCSRPYMKRSSRALAPHERSKVIGTLAMGGYWYSAMKGVCFRAYIKGHSGIDTSWTGPVLGWRCNIYSDPEYVWEPPRHGAVEYIALIGGLDTDEEIIAVNTDKYASGRFYVDRTGLHSIDKTYAMELSPEIANLIYTLNGQHALFNETDVEYQLVDTMCPFKNLKVVEGTKEDLEARLLELASGVDLWEDMAI